jgi:DNA-binding PadR family transcriptional regulator
MGRWGYGGRRGRVFEQGDLRMVMLSMIAERPRHGYDIIKALEEMTGGAYSPSPGVVYPTLTLLQEQGLAETVEADGGKKLYQATEAGRAALAAEKEAVDAVFGRIHEATARSSGAAPRIVRAMENLRTALRIKLSQGGLDAERVAAIVQTIDEAAAAVEAI